MNGLDAPEVSVVVPWYRDQNGLDRLLVALDMQDFPAGCFEVVVADDGSPEPPRVGTHPYAVRIVRQADDGFRAAAARNLGAGTARGQVLVFLDGDMMPEAGFLAAMHHAVVSAARPMLCVGRRRHADLTGWDLDMVRRWLDAHPRGSAEGDMPPRPPVLEEPQWLAEGYAITRNLAGADDTSYRFVISAAMALPAQHFAELGGFAEFRGYGGEDWELAHRWRLSGGSLCHVPQAVAWHDGPDFAGRDSTEQRRVDKDAEALRLAPLITVPGARDPRLVWTVPDVAVTLQAVALTPAQTLSILAPLVTNTDCHVWVTGLDEVVADALADPRIHTVGEPPAGVRWLVRAREVGVLSGITLAGLIGQAVAAGQDLADGLEDPGSQAPLTACHVPTGRTWPLHPAPSQWTPVPTPATSVEELWRGLANGDFPGPSCPPVTQPPQPQDQTPPTKPPTRRTP